MKKITLLFVCILALNAHAQVIDFDDDFLFAVLFSHPEIDTNGDGAIEVSEAASVTSLNLLYLADLNQITHFPNLKTLECRGSTNNVLDFSTLGQLEHIDCNDMVASLQSLNLSGLSHLKYIDVGGANLSVLDVAASINSLEYLDISGFTQFGNVDFTAYPNLKHLDCADMFVSNITVAGMTNLEYLNFANNFMATIDLSGLPNLEYLDWSNGQLTSLDVAPLTSLKHLNCSNNQIAALAVDNLTNLEYLNCSRNALTVLNVTNLTNLTTLECEVNAIPTLAVGGLVNLTRLTTSGNPLGSLALTALTNLTHLKCNGSQLTALDLAPLANLTYLECNSNQFTTLDFSTLTSLTDLSCTNNQLAAVDFSACVSLINLYCGGNLLTELDVSSSPLIASLNCSNSVQLSSVDLSNSQNLNFFDGSNCAFSTLDFSAFTNAAPGFHDYKFYNNPNLVYINAKNAATGGFNAPTFLGNPLSLLECPNLQYVCVNENDINNISTQLQGLGATNVQVNSYCSFVPGGFHNTIVGNVTFDLDSNGCGGGDSHFPGVKINVADGGIGGAIFTNGLGQYSLPVGTGFFTLTPALESPYFTITPPTATINFETLDESTQTQNFCLTPNGIHNDLEVSVFPLDAARPGFDANYVITYKNKGNQTLSGAVDLSFNDAILDFASATPTVTTQAANTLTWDFTSLQPFELRTINFTMNLNSPVEDPPVNNDDHLFYTASISPVADDETPDGNQFTLDQIVLGSMDPNDKTCLEGMTITPDLVGDYLHYVIRFQNSGTFYAENVVVKDVIDATKFDIATLQLTASSHPHSTRITGNKVEFIFEGINLPAEDDDEPGSHGFVAFKIKTRSNLVLGDNVSNYADIFFDFNAPITTEPALTTVSNLGVGRPEDTSVSVSPNPVRNRLSVSAKDAITTIQIFDIQGRLLQTALENNTHATIDFTGNSTGVYFVKVTTEKGIKTQKVVKQ